MRRRAPIAAFFVLVAGCASVIGLGDIDIGDDPDGGRDTGVDGKDIDDGGVDAITIPPVTCDQTGACAALTLPTGWQPVGVAAGEAICPNGFKAGLQRRALPIPSSDACECVVEAGAPASCNVGSLTFHGGATDAGCTNPSASIPVNAGCNRQQLNFLNVYASFVPPTGTTVTCAAAPAGHPEKVQTGLFTLCPASDCADEICGREPLGLLRSCVFADGDLACPSGPFSLKIAVGTGIDHVACSDCTCAVTSQSCGGVFHGFKDTACGSEVLTHVPNSCSLNNPSKPGEAPQIDSYEYIPDASVTVEAGPSNATSVTFAGPQTVCCVP